MVEHSDYTGGVNILYTLKIIPLSLAIALKPSKAFLYSEGRDFEEKKEITKTDIKTEL